MVSALGPPAPPTRMGEIMTISRVTRDGRGLHYDLQVLQQPERARACGSGPKSSADRRPVDPPPVVQMKIFEGPTRETAKDITFAYNADFFLGRAAPPSTPPVLTGSPVSSMILLDRPTEAGYFIFSDLSVRHEGKYFLTFSLLEEPKEERDMDADEPMSGTDEITGPDMCSARRHYSFRTTVQTDDFDVYSAKKFPGLQESTQLSRTVAEQGCRVRIRRDVRMRRREKGKGGKDVSARGEEYAQAAPSERSTATIRGRSSSNASLERVPYPQELHRRPSGLEFAPPRPSFAASEPSANRHLTFGGQPMSQYPPHPRSVPASPSYPPPAASYGHRPSYPYKPEQSPTQGYAHHPTAAGPREMYPQRVHPAALPGPPPLAPRLEPAMEPPQRPQDTILPPISEFANGVAPQRKPSYTPQPIAPMPPRSQQQFPQKAELNSPFRLEHNAFPASEYQRMQNGRREDEVADFDNFPWSEPRYERAMGPQIPAVFPSLTG
ncbi:hypothetical protein VP1G_05996 [Cytospora mali]|uniref:Velvet domain-containing protein n=1 Tax=Cytospora mali TaxID=578113 RepID=A0A194V424_CYTMA|nr:hypothetical protein VP1G_05996 [Valsa mali var. pyri (nom. inval.)]